MPRKNRVKPWPGWATEDYIVALQAVRQLNSNARKALREITEEDTDNPNVIRRLKQLTQNLASAAREAELAASRLEVARLEYRSERRASWVVKAIEELIDMGGSTTLQAEAAIRALQDKNWSNLERHLNYCLKAGQLLELLLLSGPPPEGAAALVKLNPDD